MKIYRLYGAMDLRCEEAETPSPGDGEVLIRTEVIGMCGSDLPRVLKGEVPFLPSTLGHEFSATVEKTGRGVTTVKEGDLVAVVPLTVCHQCRHCREGNFGQCTNRKFLGLRAPDRGGMAEYNVLPEENLIKVPANMNPVTAAFMEPVSVALHSLLATGYRAGKDIAVIGAGTIGQLIVQCARAMGAGRIHVFDLEKSRLDAAGEMGADFTYQVGTEGFFQSYLEKTGGFGVPFVMEVVGYESTILLAVDACGACGTVGLVGLLGQSVNIPAESLRTISFNELNLKGVWQSYSLDFPGDAFRMAMDFMASGRVKVDDMIYRVAELSEFAQCFDEMKVPGKVTGKLLFQFDKKENA